MDMQFDKDVPLPERRYDTIQRKYDWSGMEVNDSILGTQAMVSAARNWAKIHPGWKFSTRKVDKEGKQIRIWRIR